MFTGLVQTTGKLIGRKSVNEKTGRIIIQPVKKLCNLLPGESIAINGVCLTLEQPIGDGLQFFVMQETFSKTNLGELPIQSMVNMERALTLNDRIGGHLVSGHVDAASAILSLKEKDGDMEMTVELNDSIADYIVPKGSICIDGISLTVVDVNPDSGYLTVHIIPTTWNETALRYRKQGDRVNIEADMLGKYVYFQVKRMMNGRCLDQPSPAVSGISMEDLLKAGF